MCVYGYVMRTFKVYSLSIFPTYNTVLLTIVTMVSTTFPELGHLITGNFYPLTTFTHSLTQSILPLATTNLFYISVSWVFEDSTYK